MRIVIVEPNKPAYVSDVDGSLKTFQELVGGYIEAITLNSETVLICNEEGKLKGLEPNRRYGVDMICGTFFICGTSGEEFTSLSDAQLKYWTGAFKTLHGII